MGRCCGGKNAGKPISKVRWTIGQGVFLGYHSVVQCVMLLVGLASSRVWKLAKFHRQYMRSLWHEIRGLDGIKLDVATRPAAVPARTPPPPRTDAPADGASLTAR